jgi:hypothetical protein
MKNTLFVILTIFLIGNQGFAQVKLPDRANNFNFGFQINSYQNDFGLGIQLTSPYLANGYLAFRGRANMQFLQGIENGETETTWLPYQTYQLGVLGVGGKAGGFARFYGEGGVVLLSPSSSISSNSTEFGGYGLFGFEFFMSTAPETPISYFIELGGMGTGAKADQLQGSPIYSNGFTASVGFRLYLK